MLHVRFSATRTSVSLVSGIALGLVVMAGCQGGPRVAGPVRAVWVTRFDYKTAEDVTRIMTDCSEGGFNTVVFQVRGNATVFYRSQIEPWAEQFGFADPGFDPLAVACAEAHERGLALHAWVNVIPAWRGKNPPTHPEQIYHTHPEWFWYDQHGNRQALSSFYVSLNPCLPEVRTYLVEVFREIVADYDVDGLHLDYIRFPNEPPATPEGSGLDYPRDERTLALYRADTGLTPDENDAAWDQWRTDQVTQLLADIHAMMRATSPRAALSASVGTSRQRSLDHFRDDKRWVERDLLDAAFPMNYKPDLEKFKEGLAIWLPCDEDLAVVPGLWFDHRLPPDEGVEVARQQVEYALATTGNVCIFSYASLFDSGDRSQRTPTADENTNTRANRQRELREARRNTLLPILKSRAG